MELFIFRRVNFFDELQCLNTNIIIICRQLSMSDSVEIDTLQPTSFPPSVLARISPELSLQRHLAIGIRPNLRTFEEFREIHINDGGLGRYSNDKVKSSSTLGSSILRSGNSTVICTISAGIIEEDLPAESINDDAAAVNAYFAKEQELEKKKELGSLIDAAPIYPVVEVERGRVGAPTDEEMILSQKLYETFLHSGILSKESLKVNVGLRSLDAKGNVEIYYRDTEDKTAFDLGPKRAWSYVLYANIKVFSRSGPLFDLVWASVLSALRNTNLPKAYIDENAADIRIPVKIRGNHGTIREQYQITCDPLEKDPLKLNEESLGFASNFGVVDVDEESFETVDGYEQMDIDAKSILLTDIEGEEEESTAKKTITVVVDENGSNLKGLTIVGGVTKDQLHKSIELAKLRSLHLIK